jgi:tetratricopeptide (TPR) repeat protein
MPSAGHMVHMPSHIYYRVGRYADAVRSNELAVAADEDYITQCRAQGIYPLAYYPHNVHFLWAAATLEGRSRQALEAARKVAAGVTPDKVMQFSILQGFQAVPYFALVRFGRWEEILREPQPSADYPFLVAHWQYARGRAFAATGRLAEAEAELRALKAIAAGPELDKVPATFSSNTPGGVIRIAVESLAGEIAAARKDWDAAVAHLHRAVLYDDALNYIEPPDWDYPPRQSLGAVLLAAGRPLEAEVVYWEDLRRKPENGWALFGLMQALRAQGKDALAEEVELRFQKAWARADIQLTSSRF